MHKDTQLINEILIGNTLAIDELILQYYDEIFRYIIRMGCSVEGAKDITQDVFIVMMKSLPKYKEQGNFRAWLYKIAHNQTMNEFRRKNREIAKLTRQDNDLVMQDFSEDTANKEFVQVLLNQLPAKQRDVLILKYYHGFKSNEIAKITGSTLPAVKSRLFQALQKLRKYVREEG